MRDVVAAVQEALSSGQTAALATVVYTSGSTPQVPGARLLFFADGRTVGTVGGGAVEHLVINELRALIAKPEARMLRTDLTRDLGMCCGGRMEFFLEPVVAAPRVVLFGAGHVALPTARLAKSVGFDVVVVDDREELNSAARFPECERVAQEPAEYLSTHRLGPRDWVLIVTHDVRLDEEALAKTVGQAPAYVGLLGSKRKVLRLVERVRARLPETQGFPPLFAPVGLDIGAVTPEELAVSIVAELVALRHGKVVPHMKVMFVSEGTAGEFDEPAPTPR
jgi:xanthine dehydrogenase accessory factor